jgi:hypothetical protein
MDFIDFTYPKTTYNAPTKYESHGEFLQAATLRHAIGNNLHNFSVDELIWLLDFVKNGSLIQAVVGVE